ncbi:MAG: hypothetical protein QM619_02695 [Micropruina sp.]|uniref:phage tail protein n=1 Tax=Micropruina sp. TaxID=2737536 RepID=UPI0039E60AEE
MTQDRVRAPADQALRRGQASARSRPRAPLGPAAILELQRAAGNEAINALILGQLRMPGPQAARDMTDARTELNRDEPAVDKVEKGLKAAQALGIPVDLDGVRPPASALAVTSSGFGPGTVPAKKPVPPPKKTPAVSPLGKAAARPAAGAKKNAAPAPAPMAAAPAAELAPQTVVDPYQPPVAPTLVRPEDDPAFVAVTGRVATTAKQKRAHAPASAKAKEAQDAAVPPANDIGSQAKAAKADTMDAQRPGSFDKKAFITAVKAAIEAKTPKTLAQADKYKESGKTAEVKGEIKGMVADGKAGQAHDIADATAAPPDQSKAVAKPVTPMGAEPAGSVTPTPAAGAVPKPAPAEQLNLAAGTRQADDTLAEADVSEKQLAESNEPQFTEALADKKAAATQAEAAPAAYRAEEAQVIGQGKAEAQTETTAGMHGMQSSRAAALATLVADKGKAKTKDEAKRAEVTSKIDGLFNATEADVKKILDGIDPKVDKEFNAGEAAARAKFENYVDAKMSAYKKDRYGGWLGKFRWLRDKIKGMPAKVNEFYEAGRELYLQEMNRTISRVADIVGADLTAAKTRIAKGRADIASYVKSLPKDLQKVGADASKEIGDRFAQLESDVDSKQQELVDTLATKYVEARKGLDERIEELQAENRGLVDKAIGAIKAVINTIRELVAMLTDVLARAAGVVGDIVKAPVKFLGNLIAGIKGGILKFKDDFLGHLRRGLMSWLFGALAEGGIELPKSFDIKGIIGFLASIFGLTWANIRNRVVKKIGEKAMGAVEKGVEIFQVIAGPEGVGGLWQMLMEKLGNIKEMIFDQVKDFVQDRIISAGISWLIGLLNPAGAFIKACKLIYDIVMFFVNNAARLARFVNTILDSMAEIVAGNISAVVNKINDVLGQMVPIIIGFMASLIGLGGIGQKIREIIQKLQKPVNKAIDFVIKTGLKLAGPIIRGITGLGKKVKAKAAAGKAWVKGKAEAGKKWVKDKARAGAAKVKGKFGRGAGPDVAGGLTPAEVRQHEQIADTIAEALNRPGRGQAYRDVRKEKEEQARELIRTHQPKLRSGIGLSVKFADPTKDQADNDVDFEVVIAPNTTRRTGATPLDNRFYPNGFHPTSRPLDLLWLDASPATALENEQPADVPVRVALAKDELRRRFNARRSVVTAMLLVNDGQAPRAFASAAAEDALGLEGGHIVDRHVLGPHRTRLELAGRILLPGPQQNNRSSAFLTPAMANAAIASWMATTVQGANWPAFRDLILTAGTYQEALVTPGAAGWGLSYRRAPGVAVPIQNVADRPLSLGGAVARDAYPGDPAGHGNPMTIEVPCDRITVRVIAHGSAPGGWFVHSAWPA